MLQGLLLATAIHPLLASARAGASQHNAVRAADSDRATHVHRQRTPAVFVRRTLDVGSARRHAPARRIRMSGMVCHTRRRRRRPDAPSSRSTQSISHRTSGRMRYRHVFPVLHDVVCHTRPHLLSGALRPDADPGRLIPVHRHRFRGQVRHLPVPRQWLRGWARSGGLSSHKPRSSATGRERFRAARRWGRGIATGPGVRFVTFLSPGAGSGVGLVQGTILP